MTRDACIVCGQDHFEPLYEDALLRCAACGFVTANMDVDEAALARLYDAGYFKSEEIYDYLGTKASRQLNFARRLARVLAITGRQEPRNVLEIGAAYGFFGEVLLEELPGARYVGLDLAGEATAHARDVLGLDVRQADYLEHAPDAPLTDVFMWDVIEHLPRPQDFVAKAHADLAPGGHLVVGTPDIGALVPRLRGRRWRNIHPPSHLQYFSARTLEQFLKRHGFEIRSMLHPPVWRSARLLFALTAGHRLSPALARTLERLVPKGLTIPLNTGDTMVAVARKPEGDAA